MTLTNAEVCRISSVSLKQLGELTSAHSFHSHFPGQPVYLLEPEKIPSCNAAKGKVVKLTVTHRCQRMPSTLRTSLLNQQY